jgi:hypothetical protein
MAKNTDHLSSFIESAPPGEVQPFEFAASSWVSNKGAALERYDR